MSATAAPPVKSNALELKVSVRSFDVGAPLLASVSELLDGFNEMYELARWIADPNYDQAKARLRRYLEAKQAGGESADSYTTQALMSLNVEDKLQVERLTVSSPLELVTVVTAVPAAITALWGLVQIFDKLVNLQKLKLEIEKLKKELAQSGLTHDAQKVEHSQEEFMNRLNEISSYERFKYDKYSKRLTGTSLRIREIDIEIVEATRDESK